MGRGGRMRLAAYRLPKLDHPVYARAGWTAYPHQAALLDLWHEHKTFLLTSKTGSGKTAAALVPIMEDPQIERGASALFIYPTNALIEDQLRSICRTLDAFARTYYMLDSMAEAEFDQQRYSQAEVVLIRIDAETLEGFQKELHLRTKGMALLKTLKEKKTTLLLTNPDTLFNILGLRYHRGHELWPFLQNFTTLVIDEFHMYGGVELAHMLFMLHYARALGMFDRIILLSATPSRGVAELLEQLLAPYDVSQRAVARAQVGEATVIHPVNLVALEPSGQVVEVVFKKVRDLLDEIRAMHRSRDIASRIPLVIILNSVHAAIWLEDKLVEELRIEREVIGVYRGLCDPSYRSFKEKMIVIGTSAIEVGVDFDCDYLIFEATDTANFIQRLGRVGRHRVGEAYLIAPPNVVSAMERYRDNCIEREELERYIQGWYEEADARAWFVTTHGGLLTSCILVERLKDLIQRDTRSAPQEKAAILNRVDEITQAYASALGAESLYQTVKADLKLKKAIPWIEAYQRVHSFRASLPSLEVFDLREEKERQRSGNYEVDLRTILTRAKIQKCEVPTEGGKPKVVIYGYRRYVQPFADIRVGQLGKCYSLAELDRIVITGQPGASQLSNILKAENHVLCVVPESVKHALDWRIATFETPQGMLAFDGDALLLKEIYKRAGSKQGATLLMSKQ
jgi:CRISPR-associated helicase Cas3